MKPIGEAHFRPGRPPQRRHGGFSRSPRRHRQGGTKSPPCIPARAARASSSSPQGPAPDSGLAQGRDQAPATKPHAPARGRSAALIASSSSCLGTGERAGLPFNNHAWPATAMTRHSSSAPAFVLVQGTFIVSDPAGEFGRASISPSTGGFPRPGHI